MCVYLFLFCFFLSGIVVSSQWSYHIGRGLIRIESKSFSALLIDQKNWWATGPLPHLCFSKSSSQNFEIAILFSIVEMPNNYAFGDIITPPPPTASGERPLSYKIYPLFTYSICYWEVYINFLDGGGVEFSTGGIFHGDGSFQGVNFSGEILYWGTLPEFLYEIYHVSCFLFADSILRLEMLRIVVQGKLSPGFNFLESLIRGGIFLWRCSQISWNYLKNDQKLNRNQVFSTESKEQH